MRRLVQLSCITIPLACGGGQIARDGVQSPDPASATSSTPSGINSSAPAPGPSGGTTTTVALADAGDLQGAKLTETHTVASTSSSASPAPKGAHTHDPGRGPEDIAAIVKAHRDEARACYEKALGDHPGIEGDLRITWTIDPKGNVTQTSLDSSRSQITEPTVFACVSDIVKKIQFAPSPGGFETKAFYPFNFHPHHNRQAP